MSVFVMAVRRHPLAGALAFASIFVELLIAFELMVVSPYSHWLCSLIEIFMLAAPLLLLFAGLTLVCSKDVRKRKCLLGLTFGGFGLSALHAVCFQMIRAALRQMP